jgi:hypothetical protein
MNSKSVLNRILSLLSSEEVKFTDAKDAQGNILQSPTFDLGEDVEVVGADGEKSKAPDGEHEIELTDSEGNKVVIRIETKDGKITSRENVEEKSPADLEKKMDEEVVDDKAAVEEHMGAADVTTEEAKSLPNTTDEDIRNSLGEDTDEEKDPLIRMSYRIDELEKMVKDLHTKMNSAYPAEGQEVSSLEPNPMQMAKVDPTEEDEDEELPKLDGAPVEALKPQDFSKQYGKKVGNPQGDFLSKLYR